MSRLLVLCLALVLAPCPSQAGEKPSWPGRYKNPPKAQGIALLEVWGHPEHHPSYGHTAAYSRDGKHLLTAWGGGVNGDGATDDSYLSLWDPARGKVLSETRIPRFAVTAAALSPDAKTALAGLLQRDAVGKETRRLSLWDLATGKERALGDKAASVVAAAFSPDGKRALVATFTSEKDLRFEVTLWDLNTGKPLRTLKHDKDDERAVTAVAFLPGGDQALTASGSELILWNLADGAQVRAMKGHQELIVNLAVARDGKRAVTGGFDASLRLWDLSSGKELASYQHEPKNAPLCSLAFVDGGDKVLALWTPHDSGGGADEPSVMGLWDSAAKKMQWTTKGLWRGIVPMHFMEAAKKALLGGGAHPFTLIHLADGSIDKLMGGATGSINALAVAKDFVVSGDQNGRLILWQKGAPVRTITGHADSISALALSADRQFLVSASSDKTLKLWDLRTGLARKTFAGHEGNVTSVAFSPDFKWIISASSDRTLKVWDIVSAKVLQTLSGHAEGINSIALAHEGAWVASASDDNSIRLWPLKNGKLDSARETIVLEGHQRQVASVAYSPDGKHLLSGSQDKTLKLWDLARNKAVQTLSGHGNWVSSVGFFEDGTAYSTSDDLTVRLWDALKGKETGRLDLSVHSDGPRCAAILPGEPGAFVVGTSGWVILKCRQTE
ncbi:MAG: WD40 repeat domain-containing protein [Gemmataceae bacterium]|nr:WD40 repeat domain-containing protein [Gemmataceae bacterium]